MELKLDKNRLLYWSAPSELSLFPPFVLINELKKLAVCEFLSGDLDSLIACVFNRDGFDSLVDLFFLLPEFGVERDFGIVGLAFVHRLTDYSRLDYVLVSEFISG